MIVAHKLWKRESVKSEYFFLQNVTFTAQRL